jgi:plasmid rolling circle replication initiator protein Rep
MKKFKGGGIRAEKLHNKTLVKYLHNHNMDKQAKKVDSCVNNLVCTVDTKTNKKKVYNAWFCENNLCAICQQRKAMKTNIQAKKVVELTEKRLTDKHKYMFMTLTLKNVSENSVRKAIKHINRSIIKMFRYKAFNGTLGRIKTVEVTYNKQRDDYHVHAHLLLVVKPALVNSHRRLNNKLLSQLWQRATKSDYEPVVKVSTLKDTDVSTILNYITKPMNYLQFINGNDINDKSKVIDTIYSALRYQRKITFSGEFRTSNGILIAQRRNSINSDKKDAKWAKIKPAIYLYYKWSYNYCRHVLHEKVDWKR